MEEREERAKEKTTDEKETQMAMPTSLDFKAHYVQKRRKKRKEVEI
jgi:hypothetical protein